MENGFSDDLGFDKPRGQKRIKTRRNVVQNQRFKDLKIEAAITKTVYDPMNKLTKKELVRLSSVFYDGMSTVLPYSVNKHKLWEVTPFTLLQNTQNDDAEVVVLERKLTYHCGRWYFRHNEDNFRCAHFIDEDGNLLQKASARMGTRLKNLLTDHRVHSGLKDCECCRSYNEEPRVEYRMITAHENQWITTGQITWECSHRWYWSDALARCHRNRNFLKHLEYQDEFQEEDLEENDTDTGTDCYKNRRFCLGDFIVDKSLNKKEWVIVS